jgi:hypothetical protein
MLEDCCASFFPDFHDAAVRMISAQGGIFGSVTDSDTFVDKLNGSENEEQLPITTNGCSGGGNHDEKFVVVESSPHGMNAGSGGISGVPQPLDVAPQPTSTFYVDAKPYKWPYNGNMTPQNTCIIVIDMQVDFCAE